MIKKDKNDGDPFFCKLLLVGCIFFCLRTISFAADYYVHPDGSDSNTGTHIDSPWKLQYAADRVNPGDIVHLTSGRYSAPNGEGKILSIKRGGLNDAYVTFKPAKGHTPVITGGGPGIWGAIFVDAPYVRIQGLELIGDNANLDLPGAMDAYEDAKAGGQNWETYAIYNMGGIAVGDRNGSSPHHVEVVGCTIHDFPAGGIGVTKADYVTLEKNRIYNTAWYTMYAESGISIFHSFNHDDNTLTYRMVVRGNEVYNNHTQVPWIDYQRLSDGNGIIIDDNRNTQDSNTNNDIPYTGRVLVENNLSYNNGGGGVAVFLSDDVDVVNNTTYGNGKIVGYPEIRFLDSANGRSFNNITHATNGIKAFSFHNSENITSDYNIYYGGQANHLGSNDLTVDPQLNDPRRNDFTLSTLSQAIDTGGGALKAAHDITGRRRPQGKGHDRGAYESVSGLPVPNAPAGLRIQP